ncbi:hypothetical protein ZWY2020_023842 [Hordeum vulgare]|nr:hypothetical protein ZWY2020_023842 [Hordeum vulgare]
MEATALSIGKSALSGALGYAKSAVAEEVALQLGVQRDKAFVTDELEMMQSFLMVAHNEQDDHSKVIKTWVKQVRDVAYDVEDGLQDFFVRVHQKSWWRIPRTLLDRHHVAKQMKELRAKVEDVSQRNVRYRLIERGSKPANASDLTTTATAMFGVDEARRHATNLHQSGSRLDLAQLILSDKKGLGSDQIGVIGVWGTSGTVGHTSIILDAYEDPNIELSFPCRAWVRVTPFPPKRICPWYIGTVSRNRRFSAGAGGEKAGMSWHKSTMDTSTRRGQKSTVLELMQLSAEQTIYAFYQQESQDRTHSSKPTSSSILPHIFENEIQEYQSNDVVDGKMIVQENLTSTNTMTHAFEEFRLIGRDKEKYDIIELIRQHASTPQFQVIAVWGMGGVGKTTLIKDVYQSQEVYEKFGKHAFVTVLRPFKLEEFLRSLTYQLEEKKSAMDLVGDTKEDIALMGLKS